MLNSIQRRNVLIALILSLMMVISAVTALNVALPSLASDLGPTQRQLQWIVDAYGLVFSGLLLSAGAIGDRFGRRGTLLAGLGIFSIAAVAAMFANDANTLIGLRIAMGAGAALVMPVTLSIISTAFPPEERGKAVGLWVGVAGAGAIVGLLTSGLLLEWFSWNAIFALNVCLGAVAFALSFRVIPKSKDKHAAPLDFVGAALSLVGISTIVYALIEAAELGWTSFATLGLFSFGLAVLLAFVLYELRVKHPMLDPRHFTNRGFGMGTLSLMIQFFAAFGFFFIIFQYLQVVAGYSPLQSGLALLPMGLLLVPLSRHTPALAQRFGMRLTSFVGLGSIAIAFGIWAFMSTDFSYWHFLAGLIFFGTGMGFAGPPATTAITSSVSADRQGVASAVNDTARELGGALGIAALGSVMNDRYRTAIAQDFDALNVPPAIIEKAQDSIIAVQHAAAGQGNMGETLLAIAKSSYVAGLSRAMAVGAVIAIVVAICIGVAGPGAKAPSKRVSGAKS